VFAVAVLEETSERITDCQGADAAYLDIEFVAAGSVTSADSRFAGVLTAHIRGLIKRDGPTLKGAALDRFEVHDPITGELKASGTRYTLVDGALPERGMAVAVLADGSTLVAGVSVVQHGIAPAIVDHNLEQQGLPTTRVRGPIVYKFGGRTPSVNPLDVGFIQRGSCE
jgi:hypothetical protein